MNSRCTVAVLAAALTAAACAQDAPPPEAPATAPASWPRFHGPDGLGVAADADAEAWREATGASVLWKTPTPLPGTSSPIVWGDRVFLTGASATQREVYAFDAASGQLVWTGAVADVVGSPAETPDVAEETGYAAPTPATDGRRVYAIFANGDLAVFTLDGRLAWAVNVGIPANPYGHASSLALCGNLVLIQLDPASEQDGGSQMFALDAETGKIVWQAKRPVEESWATPIVVAGPAGPQVVTSANAAILAHDPKDGRILWSVECAGSEMAPSPIVAGGLVIASITYDKVYAIRPGDGDAVKCQLAWTFEDVVPNIPTPVADGGCVYLVEASGMMACCESATGKKVWEHDLEASFYASPILAAGRLFLVTRDGNLILLKAGRAYEAVAKVPLGERCDASPAFAAGRLFIRGAKNLIALGPGK